MLKKNGTAMPTQSIDELIFDMSLAFDEGKKVKEAFAAIGKAPAPGFLFLFDKNGVLVWKEVFHRCINQFVAARNTRWLISTQVFTSSWMLKQGQFAEQCALLLAGKPLIDNGARPAADDEDDEGEEIAADLGELDIPGVGDY